MSLAELLDSAAELNQHGTAVVEHGAPLTYGELAERSHRLASFLAAHGTAPGDRVMLVLPNSAQYLSSLFGILRAGGVAVPVEPRLARHELPHLLAHCRPRAAIFGGPDESILLDSVPGSLRPELVVEVGSRRVAGRPRLRSTASVVSPTEPGVPGGTPPARGGDDLAQILYTSGSSGTPKGVMLTHAGLLANTRAIVESLGLTERDRGLAILPFAFAYGNSVLLTHVAAAATLVIGGSLIFPETVVSHLAEHEVTGLPGVPSTFAILLRRSSFSRTDLPHLRYLTCAGGALAPALLEALRASQPRASLYLMYGQTEACARLSVLDPASLDRRPGSIGRGLSGVTLEVLGEDGRPVAPGEVGEIVASGPNLMKGYWNDPEMTARALRDGRLYTGDAAVVDAEGYIRVVGRLSGVIKHAGNRIHPEEIEQVIDAAPGVLESAAVGVADETWGEVVVAYVVPSEGTLVSPAELTRFVAERLPAVKVPTRFEIVARLPRTPSGKLRRGLLTGDER